ncbi:hypothetical protein Acsp05_15260 [Actinokineospora sp. NBRC 105648]|nr:hypothetical protein Acsp05_15260 [Actinokineospora sp. NBRC 105648]
MRRAREASGYTQESFAAELGMERTSIGRWERGVQAPYPWQRQRVAFALRVSLDELDELLRRTLRRAPSPSRDTATAPSRSGEKTGTFTLEADVIAAAVPDLRRSLDSLDLPDDGPTRTLAELRADVARMSEDRLQARYVDLAHRLPVVLAELGRAGQLGGQAEQRSVAALLTLALRAADGVAFKFGYLDLSARLIDRMRTAAQRAEDHLLAAAVSYVRTETFFANGDLVTAARALDLAVDELPARGTPPVASAAALAALHMRAAVVAGRAGKPDSAAEHLREARRACTTVPEGVYHGTAFGPASLRIHELAVAVELSDPVGIERASSWYPPPELPAERRSHYFIDLARAQLDLGRHEDAHASLQTARQVAPQHARAHPQVRRTLTTLLSTHSAPSSGLLDLADWAGAR